MSDINRDLNIYKIDMVAFKNKNIFKSENDYQEMMKIIADNMGNNQSVEIIAYCLAQNHCAFLINETDDGGAQYFAQDISLDYDDYFFEKYGSDGIIDHDKLTIDQISQDKLLEASRTVQTGFDCWVDHMYSSTRGYLYDDAPKWLTKKYITDRYDSAVKYFDFLSA